MEIETADAVCKESRTQLSVQGLTETESQDRNESPMSTIRPQFTGRCVQIVTKLNPLLVHGSHNNPYP